MATSDEEIFKRGIAALQGGKLEEAERDFKEILRAQPAHIAALNLLSVVLTQRQKFAEAEPYIKKALQLNPRSDATLCNYGIILHALKRPLEALENFDRALAIDANIAATWSSRGAALSELKRDEEAAASYQKALALAPAQAGAWIGYGNALAKLDRGDDALTAYDKALGLQPGLAEAWTGRGNVLGARERYADALTAYDRALGLQPGLAEAWLGRGNVLHALKRRDEALAAQDRALSLKPQLAEASLARGDLLCELRRFDEALKAHDRALALRPDFAEAWIGRGNALNGLRLYHDSLAAYQKALASKPDMAAGWFNSADAHQKLQQFAEAARCYEKLLTIAPDHKYAKGHLLHTKMLCCDWPPLAQLTQAIAADHKAGKPSIDPFSFQAISNSSRDLQICSAIFAADKFPPSPVTAWNGERYDHQKIRIGYLSGEFRHHVTSLLMVRLFELHDKSRFEIVAFDNGWDDGSEVRGRINKAIDTIVDIRTMDDVTAAAAVKEKRIDILVNLNGYFGEERTGIFSRRPAPVAASYLGFSATMGAPYIDYIIADEDVIPPDQQPFYTEKAVHLPDSFQANDDRRAAVGPAPTRAEAGLPAAGFVFCCFNNVFKITPDIFDVWMQLLNEVEGSVLWLPDNNTTTQNLRAEAARRGVAPERIVFAPRAKEQSEYLARYRAADLFLDTFPFNAGATASDALWAGLPLLTCSGEPYTSRMGGSLLKAIGLPEFSTGSLEAYKALALKLAREPALLAASKAKLAHNRERWPLFNSARTTRHLESAYVTMMERQRRGEPPASFAVAPID